MRHVKQYLTRRAQAYGLDDKLTAWTPAAIRDLLDGLNTTYEQVQRAAAQVPEWRPVYEEWTSYYKRTREKWGLLYSDSDVKEIRRREELVIDWQRRLAAKGVDTGPVRKTSDLNVDSVADALKWAAGLVVSVVVLPRLVDALVKK